MTTFLRAIVLLPIALLAILFAIANRAPVTLSLDPFAKGEPEIALAVPLYAIVFAAVVLGVVLGGIGAWLSGARARRSGRASRREANGLKAEAERLRASLAASRGPALPAPRRAA